MADDDLVERAVTLRRSLTLLVVLVVLLLSTTSPLVEDAAEWVGQRIHQPATHS